MARVEIAESVLVKGAGGAVRVGSGASVQVKVRGGDAATVYEAATGVATLTNPLTANAEGLIEGWLEPGSYDLVVTLYQGGESYTQRYEAISGNVAGVRVRPRESGESSDNAAFLEAFADGLVIELDGNRVYEIDLDTADLEVPNGTIVHGNGAIVRSKQTSYSVAGGVALFVTASGGTMRWEGVRFYGPSTLINDTGAVPQGSSTEVYLLQAYGVGSEVIARDCEMHRASFYVWASSDDSSVDLEGCKLYGWDGATKCTGVLFSGGGTSRWCRIHNCIIRAFGFTGSPFFHGLYIDDGVQVDVIGNRFEDHWGTGFYIQLHDGVDGSDHQLIQGNFFGAYAVGADTAKGINTSNQRPGSVTQILDNTFACQNHCLELDGDAVVRGNRFTGDGTGATNNFWIIGTEDDSDVVIEGNDFVGVIDNPIRIDWDSQNWTIRGNRFRGTFVDCINLEDSIATSRVEVLDNEFSGAGIGDYCIVARAGGILTVKGNRFRPTLDASVICVRCSSPGTLSRLVVKDNDFSQAGAVATSIDVSSVRPPVLDIQRNYGSTGFKTENSGNTAVVDSGLIAHGLGSAACTITPTRYNAEPTGAGGNRICNVISRDTTNIGIELKRITGPTGDPVVVAENVTWSAEY